MIKQEFTQEIKRPVEEVFAYVTNFRNNAKWQPGLIESTQTPDGPAQVGTKVKDVRNFVGQKLESVYEVTELVPNKKVVFKSAGGPIQFQFTQTFEAMPGGTKIVSAVEMEAGGFFKLAEGMVAGSLKKDFDAGAEKLKALLEGAG